MVDRVQHYLIDWKRNLLNKASGEGGALVGSMLNTIPNYAILKAIISTTLEELTFHLKSRVEDIAVWSSSLNGTYLMTEGYTWMIYGRVRPIGYDFRFVWRLKIMEKMKFLMWLVCHDLVPINALHFNRDTSSSNLYGRCNLHVEYQCHVIRSASFNGLRNEDGAWLCGFNGFLGTVDSLQAKLQTL
ncbi:hypothetical protein RJT34_24525 [Clitoria ternatea]|uniref:Reverse transcriptase zinc-binding domain-containing protein n=1 Tax=Clitoria ternatea TaxID=43366 RepID=A0AAN9IHK8_CLITE